MRNPEEKAEKKERHAELTRKKGSDNL